MTDIESIKKMLVDKGVPQEVIDSVPDDELEKLVQLAERASKEASANNGMRPITDPNGNPAFEVETDYFKTIIPSVHMYFVASMFNNMMRTAKENWENSPTEFRKAQWDNDPAKLTGEIFFQAASVIIQYINSHEDIMEELAMCDPALKPHKQRNDCMFG